MSDTDSDAGARLGALRQKLLRKQYYAIFMTPPEPMADPITAFGPTSPPERRSQAASIRT